MNLNGIRAGDIVRIDGPAAKGADGLAVHTHRYHALVLDNPGGELRVRPIDRVETRAFNVRPRLVVEHWRKAGRPRRRRDHAFETALA